MIVTPLKNLICLTLFFAFAACGSDQIKAPGGSDSGDDNTSGLPDSLTKLIGPDGGVLRIRGVTLTIPRDALKRSTEITISNLGDKAISKLPAPAPGLSRMGRPAAFEPHGQAFELPVEIEMTADSEAKRVSVQRLEDDKDQTWESIALVTDNLPQVKFGTRTFSIYSLFGGEETGLPAGTGGSLGVGGGSATGGSLASVGGSSPGTGGKSSGGGGLGGELGSAGDSSVGGMEAYFDDGTWRGAWFPIDPASSTIETNLSGGVEPYCVTSGTVGVRESAGLGFYLNQDADGSPLSYMPERAEGFSFSIHNEAQANLEFQVGLVDPDGNVYCVQRAVSEREELVTREVFFSDLQLCAGTGTGATEFHALRVEVLGPAPDASFCVGNFAHEGFVVD